MEAIRTSWTPARADRFLCPVVGGLGPAVAAAVEQQRAAGGVGAEVEHPRGDDRAVAPVVLGPPRASDPRDHALEAGGALAAGAPRAAGQLGGAPPGEPTR